MKRITANLIVESIEDCLPFWVDRLEFEKTVEVPQGDGLGFVILKSAETELMLQSIASIKEDVTSAPLADEPFHTNLFIEVEDIDDIEKRLDGIAHVCPRQKTFYGSDEIIVRDPAGNIITFAQFPENTPD